jgi:hypothetical protein
MRLHKGWGTWRFYDANFRDTILEPHDGRGFYGTAEAVLIQNYGATSQPQIVYFLQRNSNLKRVFFALPFWLSVSSSSCFSSHDTGLVVAK